MSKQLMFLLMLSLSNVLMSFNSKQIDEPKGGFMSLDIGDETSRTVEYTVNNKTAEVNQVQGFYLFVESEPVKAYKYLGTVGKSMSLFGSGQYTDMRDKLIKKAKRNFPNANGLIFHFKDGGRDKVDVIQIE